MPDMLIQLPNAFLTLVRDFAAFGAPTLERTEGGIPYLINEYWTAKQRQGGSIHGVPYRACFKSELPEFFISRLTEPGDTVHDPFMGRGTTPVQAALMGRRPVGSDVSPLSVMLARPRLRPPTAAQVTARLREVPWSAGQIEREDLLAFYHPGTLRQIEALKGWLLQRVPLDCPDPDPVDDWIRMAALARLSGHSPGFFSVYSMPPNQAVSARSQLQINTKRNQVPPLRDVAALIIKITKSLLGKAPPPPHPAGLLATCPAHATPLVLSGSVHLVVTSPPFLDTVQYADDNWLRCWFAGIDVQSVALSMHAVQSDWTAMVRAALTEMARVLVPGGHVAFEVGEVRKGTVLLERFVWQAAEGLPFERMGVLINQQEFTKTANCWDIKNNKSGTNTNRIVMLRRHS